MGKTVVLVHGRSYKPDEATLRGLWVDALRHGLARDGHAAALQRLSSVRIEMVYYGDLSNGFLASRGGRYDAAADAADRHASLAALKAYPAQRFNRRAYRQLPGASGFKEFLADVGATTLGPIHLSDSLIKAVAPDMEHYWNEETAFGSEVRARMTGPLQRALARGDDVLVVAHSLGTLVCYDTFWKFSRYAEYRQFRDSPISLWITLGSPLADETVKRNLKGASIPGPRRFPANVRRWLNFAAEDDFISHDKTVGNDYRDMRRHGLVEAIVDRRIYNLAVRHGRSNPHNAVGYLLQPKVIESIAAWV